MEISDIILNKRQLALLNRKIENIDFLLDYLNYLFRIRDDLKNAGNEKYLKHVEKVIKSDEKWLYKIYKKALNKGESKFKKRFSIFYSDYLDGSKKNHPNFMEIDYFLDSLSKLYQDRKKIIEKGTFDQEYNKKRKENFLDIIYLKRDLKYLSEKYFLSNKNNK